MQMRVPIRVPRRATVALAGARPSRDAVADRAPTLLLGLPRSGATDLLALRVRTALGDSDQLEVRGRYFARLVSASTRATGPQRVVEFVDWRYAPTSLVSSPHRSGRLVE